MNAQLIIYFLSIVIDFSPQLRLIFKAISQDLSATAYCLHTIPYSCQ